MRSFIFSIFLCASATAIAIAAPDRLQIATVEGPAEVSVLVAGEKVESKISKGAWLTAGSELKTAAGQIVTLSDQAGSKWQLGPEAKLRLESNSRVGGNPRLMALIKGNMWGANHSGSGKDFRLKVRTNSGALGVKSGEFLLQEKEGLSSVDAVAGQIYFGNSLDFSKGSFVLVRAGQRSSLKRVGNKGRMVPQMPVATQIEAGKLFSSYGFSELEKK